MGKLSGGEYSAMRAAKISGMYPVMGAVMSVVIDAVMAMANTDAGEKHRRP